MQVSSKEILLLLLLLATTDGTSPSTTFLASTNCKQALSTRSGTITSPASFNPQNCEWRITTASDERILLTVTNLDTPKDPKCALGHVEIRDGFWYTSPLLGRFCGGAPLNPIASSGEEMLINYVNNNPNGVSGFTATYEGICGGDLFVDNATNITTPNHPELYPLDKKCIWRIIVPDGYKVVLTFDSFDIENQNDCLYDYLEIRDGLTLESRPFGRYCNMRGPGQITSSGNHLLLLFVSDSSVARRGFAANVYAEQDECFTGHHKCAQICTNTLGSYKCSCNPGFELLPDQINCKPYCGGTLLGATGRFASPLYPNLYPLNTTCTWEIVPPPHHSVILSYDHFDIEGTSPIDCPKDKLEYYISISTDLLVSSSDFCRNNASTTEDYFFLVGTTCGIDVPNPTIIRGSKVRVVFKSDGTVQKTGFSASYHTTLDGCSIGNGNCETCSNHNGSTQCYCSPGKNLTALPNGRGCFDGDCKYEIGSSSGVISSPNYPGVYSNNKDCEWKFTTTPGHRLQVTFSRFQLQADASCRYDNVTFYDSRNNLIGKFCGPVKPPPIISPDNKLRMTFKTNNVIVYYGFTGTYSSICGGNLITSYTKQYIFSHANFGYSDYSNNTLCEWKITAPAGKFVTVAFVQFELENSGGCSWDYVEFVSERNGTPTFYGKFCGQTKPPRICSTGDNLLIRFRTDSSVAKKGFSLVYKTADQAYVPLIN